VGEKAIKPLQKLARRSKTDSKQLIQVLWALHRLNGLPDDILLSGFQNTDATVQVHALKIAANYKTLNGNLLVGARQNLMHKNPHVQRAAAETLGRHPESKAFEPLALAVYGPAGPEKLPAGTRHYAAGFSRKLVEGCRKYDCRGSCRCTISTRCYVFAPLFANPSGTSCPPINL
jgi:hypothetical protein